MTTPNSSSPVDPIMVRIFHTDDLSNARFEPAGSISVTEVYRYAIDPSPDPASDATILNRAWHLFTVGDDPERGKVDRLALDYWARGNRRLSVGDTVAIGDRHYQRSPVGWQELSGPPIEDPTGAEPTSTPYDPDFVPPRTTVVVLLEVVVDTHAWRLTYDTDPRLDLPGYIAHTARFAEHLVTLATVPADGGEVTLAGSQVISEYHTTLTTSIALAVTVPTDPWRRLTGTDPLAGIGPHLAAELSAARPMVEELAGSVTYLPVASGVWNPDYNAAQAVQRYRAVALAFRRAYFGAGSQAHNDAAAEPHQQTGEAIRAELIAAGRWPLATALRDEHDRLTLVYEEQLRDPDDDSGLAIWRPRAAAATAEVDRLAARTAP